MFANVAATRSLKSSLYYDRALRSPEKGGRVIMANGVGLHMSPTAQLAMLEAYVNPKFKVKAYSVMISHSDADNERLKDHKFQERLLHEFVNACKNRGIDLDNIPYIIPEHTNTDNIHYHMLMLINHFDGSRINTQYLGKRMAMAAVDVSKKFGLHYSEGWDEREARKKKHQAARVSAPETRNTEVDSSEARPQTMAAAPPAAPVGKVGLSDEEIRKLNDRIRRKNAALAAKKKKEDEAKQAERDSKERVQVQKQKAEGREKIGQGDRQPKAERERRSRRHSR